MIHRLISVANLLPRLPYLRSDPFLCRPVVRLTFYISPTYTADVTVRRLPRRPGATHAFGHTFTCNNRAVAVATAAHATAVALPTDVQVVVRFDGIVDLLTWTC